jgi:serine/threonine-protein kinase HipA
MTQQERLDVYVSDRRVGTLGPAAGGSYVFAYLPDVAPDDFVSLTMPVRLSSYEWSRGLPPFFLMNLPEGYQKDLVRRKLGPHAEVTDVGLLALTGRRTIGRVRVVPTGQPLASAADDLELATLLATPDSRDHLLEYLARTVAEGVSGVMPKTLATKATAIANGWLLKTGPADLPGLAINEFLCLEVARRVKGMIVPEARLSADGQVLAVRRFDRPDDREWLGVEDFCSLKGLDPVSKYRGSLEDISKLLTTYVPSPQVSESALRLFRLWCLNYALRNADAHLKNYALTYTSRDDVALAPVYDIVTVTAYPEFKNDIPALTISGRKVWRAGTLLQQAGAVRLSLTRTQMNACVEEITAAMEATAPDVRRYSEEYPKFRDVAKRVLMAWDEGMLDLSPTATAKSKPKSKLVSESGLSGPEKPRRRAKSPFRDAGPLSSKIR